MAIIDVWEYDCKTKEGRLVQKEDPNFPANPQIKDIKAEFAVASDKLDYIAKHLGMK